jgi:hypothetical protein
MLNVTFTTASVLLAATVVAHSGCRRSIDDAPATALSAIAALPRTNASTEDRGAWRQHLRWPDGCEDAFQVSHAGTDGGLTFTPLGDGVSLVEIVCAAGSYQPSVVRMRLVESADGVKATTLALPVYQSEDGRQVTLVRQTEVWGDSTVLGDERALVVLAFARQTSDCGVWARYSLADAEPRITQAAARLDCPTPPADPASLSPTDPPRGWVSIPQKD